VTLPSHTQPDSTNSPASQTELVVEFLDNGGNGIVTNTFDLIAAGLPNGGPATMALFATSEYTEPARTAAVRVGARMANAYGTGGSQSFFVDAFDLESVAPPGSPVITNQPVATTVSAGDTATFSVGVSSTAGVSYQWQLNNANLANSAGHISGATGPTLTITGVSAGDAGRYHPINMIAMAPALHPTARVVQPPVEPFLDEPRVATIIRPHFESGVH
jgi:hypothetical protein